MASTPEQIARHLRRAIVDGRLQRGERIPQEAVAAELGVSRIPVREALAALDREGWVTIERHRGAFVCGVDAQWITDHYAILGALYGLAAEQAASRASAAEFAELRTLAITARNAGDVDEFDALNHQWFDTVLAAARSPRVVTALRAVTAVVPGNFFAQVPDTLEPQRRALGPITRALGQRDGAGAATRIRRLLDGHGLAVVALLETRGVLLDAETQEVAWQKNA